MQTRVVAGRGRGCVVRSRVGPLLSCATILPLVVGFCNVRAGEDPGLETCLSFS